jgi:competence protein ComEC
MVILPFLGVILAYGIILIFLAVLNILPDVVATIYGQIITAMNTFVDWVSKQEQFLFRDISITILQVILSYVVIITLVKFFKNRTYSNLRLLLISVLLFQGIFLYNAYINATHEFIIFHKNRFTVIGEKSNTKLEINHNLDSVAMAKDHVLKNFEVGNFITETEKRPIKNVYEINSKKLLVIDSFGVYNVKTFKPNYVLLRNSPKINLVRMIDSLHPELIIADGSNYRSYVNRWETTCAKQKLPFYSTSKKGAFIIK